MKINKTATVQNIPYWQARRQPVAELLPLCRQMAAEGSVLLKNDGSLPFAKGSKIALFGRNQEGYIKSGTGSGGLVRVAKQPCLWDSFAAQNDLTLDGELVDIYKAWIAEHPFDNGHGWATEPWFQAEMPVSQELAERFAAQNDAAVVIIGRTAGEDKDNQNKPGSYLLTQEEEDLLAHVTAAFAKTVVVLNVGNPIDLSFLDAYPISALLYVWQGGQEGANALVDLLAGVVSPCGKLPDTQLATMEDLPFLQDFGHESRLVYQEDIYVGYRYYETFCPQMVRFPFGFGLTYTKFQVDCTADLAGDEICVLAKVQNVGGFAAKEVVQVYFGAPCGTLGTPAKQLAAFAKTRLLQPGESQTLSLSFPVSQMAAYDDSGITGNPYCYVLQAGVYEIFAGTDLRQAKKVLEWKLPTLQVTEQLEQIMPPLAAFERLVAKEDAGNRVAVLTPAPKAQRDLEARITARRPQELAFAGNQGIRLVDVADGKATLDDFVAQLTDDDLAAMVCGEGMDSPKVTPGTGGAFGGVTPNLLQLGVPVCCVSDGPSGIRVGNDYKTTSLPNGYVFASSFDIALTQRLFELEGVELFAYGIDALLGPGMNIHRHPLCGRNFEYFSEDPLLSGKIAAAQTKGLAATGCTTTIKHFCCNNQEYYRNMVDVVVSERALREIYLKGFEIAVKEGGATAIMTSYNLVNGYYSASNYDLTTTLLRGEWGYQGFVMTDWWAKCNLLGQAGTCENLKAMVQAQNDIFMVCPDAQTKVHNIYEGLQEGFITRGDLQRCAKNLLAYILNSPTFARFVQGGCVVAKPEAPDEAAMETVASFGDLAAGDVKPISLQQDANLLFVFDALSHADALAQNPIGLMVDGQTALTFSLGGTDGKVVQVKRQLHLSQGEHTLGFVFPPVMELKQVTVKQ